MNVKLNNEEIELIKEALCTLWGESKGNREKQQQLVAIDSKLRFAQIEGGKE